ncbi:hypothetical protein GCM10010193_35590 [Kitasatospora atroaurantiaca]|uniref:Parallel beta helix pectate lyase-like protein n=1 Tax=Kitasatospora atroaurantiaca TaxID=285545 RepID=A0A561ETG4_9ACTN|nr:right-handed parallel beta-helix repeat-containing protein [Kitasatospora atroaurantiaca]TWE18895.1 parallel beta helix pectate lyase-like protein [Kitasatospora atroaurantiaca]
MRPRQLAAVTALVLATGGLAAVTGPEAGAFDAIVYVNNTSPDCTDDPVHVHSEAVPFCTLQSASESAFPGQTVQTSGGSYNEDLVITASGMKDHPVTYKGLRTKSVTVKGAHDVVFTQGAFNSRYTTGLTITDSSRVTVEQSGFQGNRIPQAGTKAPVTLAINGLSSEITVRRSEFQFSAGSAVSIGAGVTGTVFTTNYVHGMAGPVIDVQDAPGTVITGNTIIWPCGSAIVLNGGSTGSSVQNNISARDQSQWTSGMPCLGTSSDPDIAVADSSAQQTTIDYNLLKPTADSEPYSWGGVAYSLKDFQAKSGQGTHELYADPQLSAPDPWFPHLAEGSPAIDSANPVAPGELPTDLQLASRTRDVLVKPLNGSTHDRGAFELTNTLQLGDAVEVDHPRGPFPLPVHAIVPVTSAGTVPVQYTFDFGDGSAPVTTDKPYADHTYDHVASGPFYSIAAKVTSPFGPVTTVHSPGMVTVVPPTPLQAALTVGPDTYSHAAMGVNADSSASAHDWPIVKRVYDFGDATQPTDSTYDSSVHLYSKTGTYTVTVTETDSIGRTSSATQQTTVGAVYAPLTPTRVLDTRYGTGAPKQRVGASGELRLKLRGVAGLPNTAVGMTTAVLNVTVVNPSSGGFVTAYPDSMPRPTSSNLNFEAGQTVSNLVVVPVGSDGSVKLYNFSAGTDLVADLQGYYFDGPSGGPEKPSSLNRTTPTRVLDTRYGTGSPQQTQVGNGATVDLQVTGTAGVPAGATAVMLNVTAAAPASAGYVTVYPTGSARPTASNLNFGAGRDTANLVIVPIGKDGKVSLYNFSAGVGLVADLVGYFTPLDAQNHPFVFTLPSRVLDTRTGNGAPVARLGAGKSLRVKVAGRELGGSAGTVPDHVTAVLVNLTAVSGTANSYVTAYAGGTTRPGTSTVNFPAWKVVPNLALVPVGADGTIELYNFAGDVDLVADLAGYYFN